MAPKGAYSEELTRAYDRRHFGGRSGQYILQRDLQAVQSLLGYVDGLILDIPCGTGAYLVPLVEHGHDVVAADASPPMLRVAGQNAVDAPRVLCDVHHLPFRDGAFNASVTLRLFSHIPKHALLPVLQELKRAVRSRGVLIFDTFRWTPRRWPLFRRFLEQSFIHVLAHDEVERLICRAGLEKVGARHLYLFSPLWQRKLPFWLLRSLTAFEQLLPPRWLLRTFWACTRDPASDDR